MRYIELTQGYKSMIDCSNYNLLNNWSWRITPNGYAIASDKKIIKGERRHFYMHRVVLSAKKGQQIDHINGNKLDNRVSNLRFSTQQQNIANAKKRKGKSKYKGVNPTKGGRWFAATHKNGERFYLGRFDYEEDAAKAYDKKLIELYGEFACINFPL